MLERSHLESYICYCKYQKNLNNKTLKAYRIDLMQFFSWFFPYDACVSSTHICTENGSEWVYPAHRPCARKRADLSATALF